MAAPVYRRGGARSCRAFSEWSAARIQIRYLGRGAPRAFYRALARAGVHAGWQCGQVACLGDFMATCADLLQLNLPDNAGEDSVSLLPAMLGTRDTPFMKQLYIIRREVISLSATAIGSLICVRVAVAGMALPRTSYTERDRPQFNSTICRADIGERHNLERDHPEIVRRLSELLERYVARGRSNPGQPLSNDAPVDIWKSSQPIGSTKSMD